MARREKKRTLLEELQYWKSMQLEAHLSVEDYDRRIGDCDREIQSLQAKRERLVHDREVAPEIAERAATNIERVTRLITMAQLVGSSPRTSSREQMERKRERTVKKVARLNKIRSQIAELRRQGVDVEKILRGES